MTFRIIKGEEVVVEGASPLVISGIAPNTEVTAGTYKAIRLAENENELNSDPVDIPAFKTDSIAVSSVTLDKQTLEMAPGETVKLNATVLPEDATDKSGSWSSSQTSVATVSGGTVTIKADATDGNTTKITFTTKDGGKTATCDIVVKIQVEPEE